MSRPTRHDAGSALNGIALPFPVLLCSGDSLEATLRIERAMNPGAVIVGTQSAMTDDLASLETWRDGEDILAAADDMTFAELHETRTQVASEDETEEDDDEDIELDEAEAMLDNLIVGLHLEDSLRTDGLIEADAMAALQVFEDREAAEEDAVITSPPTAFDTFGLNRVTGAWHPGVAIAILPAATNAEIPAFYDIGGWGTLPKPEEHIVYARRWAETCGAELIGFALGRVTFTVARPPRSLEAALALAHEHVSYCPGILEQVEGDLDALAETLMDASEWCFFWG